MSLKASGQLGMDLPGSGENGKGSLGRRFHLGWLEKPPRVQDHA